MNVKRAGLDIGYGQVKACLIEDGEIRTTMFPAVVGDAQALSAFRLGLGGRRRSPKVVTYNGFDYFVGWDCLAHSRVTAGRQDRARIGSDEERLLALVALARLGVEDCVVVAGLPWAWYADRRRLKKSLVGEHHLSIGHKEHTVLIREVRVVPQPVGGFYSTFLDKRGVARASEEEMNRTYGFLDIGWNTVDFTALRRLEPVEAWCGGATIGVRRVIEIVADRIERTHHLELSAQEVDQAIRDGHVEVYGRVVDISQWVNSAAQAVARQIRAKATALWGNGERFSKIFIFGGGAFIMGKELKRAFPHNSEVLPQPCLANAIGFAKFAQRRVFRLDRNKGSEE